MSSSRQHEYHDRDSDPRGSHDRLGDSGGYVMPESDEIIRKVMDIIEASPSMPMSSSVRVNKEEVLEMLASALEQIPDDVRQAKWLLKDREAFLAEREREAEAIIARAASNAARLVERREIVQAAETRAAEIIETASRTARRRQREADDYCDQQLARYENALAKLHKQVSKMRDRLSAPSIEESELGNHEARNAPGGQPESQSRSRTGQIKAVGARGSPSGEQVVDGRRQPRPAGPSGRAPRPSPRSAAFDQDG